MRFVLLFLILALAVCSGFGAQDSKASRFWRSKKSLYHPVRRSADRQYVKGQAAPQVSHSLSKLEMNLRKGEYMCGNKVCKLRRGEVPPGCNGMCQYPVK